MPNVDLAERIVSLALPPARAHSTVGDLMEESASRGAVWFWCSVAQTAFTQLAQDLQAAPFKMLGLAAWGWLAELVLSGVIAIGLSLIVMVLGWIFSVDCGGARCDIALDWQNSAYLIPLDVVIPFLAAKLTAERSQGRELPAIVALNLFHWMLHLATLYLSIRQLRQIGQPLPGLEPWTLALLYRPLLSAAAALWARHNRLSSERLSCAGVRLARSLGRR